MSQSSSQPLCCTSIQLFKNWPDCILRNVAIFLSTNDFRLLKLSLEEIAPDYDADPLVHECFREMATAYVHKYPKFFCHFLNCDELERNKFNDIVDRNINDPFLQFTSDFLRNDYATMMIVVSHCGCLFRFADSEWIRKSYEISELAMWNSQTRAIKWTLNMQILNNTTLIRNVVKDYEYPDGFLLLEWVSEQSADDDEFVLFCVEHDWENFEFTNERLRGNKHIALSAVRQNPPYLEFTSLEMRDDYDVVFEAISDTEFSTTELQFASDRLKDDYHLVMTAVECSPQQFQYASLRLRDDFDIVREAVRADNSMLQFASDRLRGNNLIVGV